MSTLRRRVAGYRWELLLFVLILGAVAISAQLSPFYLDAAQILSSLRYIAIPGLLALGLAVIVIQGEIDISLPSLIAVGSVMLGWLASLDVAYPAAVVVVLLVGMLVGFVNGAIVTSFSLPSMAVTLGSMAALRGIAYLLPGGEQSYAADVFDPVYFWLGDAYILEIVPVSLVLLAVASVVFAILMHGTVFGRLTYTIGNNALAARFSGTRVTTLKISAYVLAGLMAGIGSLVFVGQYQSARGDNFDGQLLFVVTAVVLGGIDLNGGKGNILGVVLSLVLLGTLYNGMGLGNVDAPIQVVVFGSLLVVAVLSHQVAAHVRAVAAFRRVRRASPVVSA